MIDNIKEQLARMAPYEDMNSKSWGYEEGIIISGNEAKVVIEMYEALELLEFACMNGGAMDFVKNIDTAMSKAKQALFKARGEQTTQP